jgi:glycosyltransferase involved in cell wall biosynthesis
MGKDTSKPKVLFILHLPPPIHGAAVAGSYIKNSVTINQALEAEYINLATNTTLSQTGKASFKKVKAFLVLLLSVVTRLSRNQFDVCYITLTAGGPAFYKDFIVVALVKLFRTKIIYHFHNKGVASASKNGITRAMFRFVFKNSKSILLSPHLYPDIQQYVKEQDVYYCPCGIPAQDVFSNKDSLINDKPERCTLLFLSNMMYEKGVYVLLDAAKELKGRKLNFECHFIGAWSDIKESDFEQKVQENNLAGIVFAHGPKYGIDKHSFFCKADVFVFPTFYHYETFGLVNLEAMQYKLPVVSTPEGGIPDVVADGKTGFLVPQKDPKALADALEVLIRNPSLRTKMGQEGIKRFETFFTLDHFESRITEILREVSNKQVNQNTRVINKSIPQYNKHV